jgi:catechol 2,3-dioxygenase-like lactoylglutathione lyase family enzyme
MSADLAAQLTIFASDLAATRAFYAERLGCRIEDAGEVLFAERDGLRLRIEGGARPRKRGRHWMEEAGVLVTLLPSDFDALVAELEERGVKLLGGITTDDEGRRYTGFADPDGNLFEITGA